MTFSLGLQVTSSLLIFRRLLNSSFILASLANPIFESLLLVNLLHQFMSQKITKFWNIPLSGRICSNNVNNILGPRLANNAVQ